MHSVSKSIDTLRSGTVLFGSKRKRASISAAAACATMLGLASPAQAERVWDITYDGGGKIIQYNDDKLFSPDKVRICLKNRTGQPKRVLWKKVQPANPISMLVNKGQQSCVTLPPDQTIEFDFQDRGQSVSAGRINLRSVRGDLILFDWVADTNLSGVEYCGGLNQRPCKLWERIPSCDDGLVENFLKGACLKGARWREYQTANAKLAEIGDFIIGQIGFAARSASDPGLDAALQSENPRAISANLDPGENEGGWKIPTGGTIRTLTVGPSVGVKFIAGAGTGAGGTHDLTGRLPPYAYGSADVSGSLGFGVEGGMEFGFWICQANKIGGDIWGVEYTADELIGLGKFKSMEAFKDAMKLKPGLDIGIGLWFDYNNVFQGFTITPTWGASVSLLPGTYVRATTAVQDDPTVKCDGSPETAVASQPFDGLMGEVQRIAAQKAFANGHQIVFFEGCNYTGRRIAIPNGRHSLASLRKLGVANDWVSSIMVTPGNRVAIYRDDNFAGGRLDITKDTPCLPSVPFATFNDQLSSAIVWRE